MTEIRRKTRVWAIPPDPPDEVIVVWDRRNQPWVRPLPARRWYQADPKTLRQYPGRGLPWLDLLATDGPLTDTPPRTRSAQTGDAR